MFERRSKMKIVLLLICSTYLCAQVEANDYQQYDGFVIDSVIIENKNIYDLSEDKFDNFLFKTANKLHLKTKKNIIRQELLLFSGDNFDSRLALETERNLRQNLIIYDAYLLIKKNSDNKLVIRVVTVDQWSFIGSFNFKREGNLNSFNVLVEERNFLGLNKFLSLNYFSESIEKDYINLTFLEKRLFYQPLRFLWFYSNSRTNQTNQVIVSHPYYNLLQSYSYSFNFGFSETITKQYYDSLEIAEAKINSDYFGFGFGYRFGSYDKKMKISGVYDYRNNKVIEQNVMQGFNDSIEIFQDSIIHRFGFGVSFNTYNFMKLQQVDGYGYVEDFNIGYQASLFLFRKYDSDFEQVDENEISMVAGFSGFRENNLYSLVMNNSVWLRNGKKIRNYSKVKLSWYNINLDYVTFVFRGRYDYNWSINNSDNLILSGISNLRGYPKYYKTGNKKIVLNHETRFFTGLEILSVNLGVALFTDIGNVWKCGEKVSMSDFKSNIGVGLRFYPERVSNNSVVRMDFSYSKEFDWSVSINSNHYFDAL